MRSLRIADLPIDTEAQLRSTPKKWGGAWSNLERAPSLALNFGWQPMSKDGRRRLGLDSMRSMAERGRSFYGV